MQIYYINLARRPDRRAFMEAQFEKLGLKATRIEAVTPAQLTPEQLSRYCNPKIADSIPPVHYACSMSHATALSLAARSSGSFAVIFEDDVVLSASLPPFLSELERRRPPFDLIRIETTLKGLRLKRGREQIAGIELARPFGWEPGSGGYIISQRAAATIGESGVLERNHVDWALFQPFGPLAGRLTWGQTIPALCCQTSEMPSSTNVLASDTSAATLGDPSGGAGTMQMARARLRAILYREIIIGTQRTFHQMLGARKEIVPFLE